MVTDNRRILDKLRYTLVICVLSCGQCMTIVLYLVLHVFIQSCRRARELAELTEPCNGRLVRAGCHSRLHTSPVWDPAVSTVSPAL